MAAKIRGIEHRVDALSELLKTIDGRVCALEAAMRSLKPDPIPKGDTPPKKKDWFFGK